ncbi:ATP-grasp domain-containing protein [Pelosinus baikalensis]|uniref:ATP-grasp domain-containing protein n=1 Tax=Pelosinus baikalensis TaxID=2892015 RepID=A0ABS8HYS6_9FIRM|nr:ATP-grasp domain-containing protein [Pelosinus baikalensis]MCC5468316.1 ATP-grasp domain-containing protein [Pelosinus baikalensis]
MKNQDKFCVIVDPYVNIDAIVKSFIQENVKCIALFSDPIDPKKRKLKFPEELEKLFYKTVNWYENESSVLAYFKSINIIGIINGSDMGIEITDEIGNALNLSNVNSSSSSMARRNKYISNIYLKKNNVPSSKQLLINYNLIDSIIRDKYLMFQFLEKAEQEISFPLVLKPTQSRGSFGVSICNTQVELREAIEFTFGKKDSYGMAVNELIVEELLKGNEYVVDTVSINGKHCISGVYCYEKEVIDTHPIYRSTTLVDCYSEKTQKLKKYALQVLDALEFRNGAAHMELFLTELGPRLVEINPRVHGAYGFTNKLCKLSTGRNQIDMLVEAYVNPEDFYGKFSSDYVTRGYGKKIELQYFGEGILEEYSGLEEIKRLSSFRDVHFKIQPGEYIGKTINLSNTPGLVLFFNDSNEQLERDYLEFLNIEKTRLYKVKKN